MFYIWLFETRLMNLKVTKFFLLIFILVIFLEIYESAFEERTIPAQDLEWTGWSRETFLLIGRILKQLQPKDSKTLWERLTSLM